jgi:hypothetical protein
MMSLISVFMFIAVYLFTISKHIKPFPDRVFPLYIPTIINNGTALNATIDSANDTSSMNLTSVENVTASNNVTINSEL